MDQLTVNGRIFLFILFRAFDLFWVIFHWLSTICSIYMNLLDVETCFYCFLNKSESKVSVVLLPMFIAKRKPQRGLHRGGCQL
jgi:hypothetical protein